MTAPALRLATPEPSLGESLIGMWDQELERNILGAAMLAEPMPRWLEPRHFFPTDHQRIFEAVLAAGGELPLVAVRLRESGYLFRADWHGYDIGPGSTNRITASYLAEMCLEAEHARRMGWSLDFDRLRELAKRRALLETLTRQAILLRGGEWSHAECYGALRDYFRSSK